jgi:hypothetical protein
MKSKLFFSISFLFILFAIAGAAHADMLKITANSKSYGEIGWFAIDDTILINDDSIAASQFYDYWFSDPKHSGVTISPADVTGDTGLTYFEYGSEWTVSGGGGYSLTTPTTSLWISGHHKIGFLNYDSFNDITWTTADYECSVPEPATMLLLGSGLTGFVVFRKRFLK